MPLVTIDRFTSLAAANVARATLEAEGIEAFLADEIESQSHGGVRLQVAREDVEEALDILRDAHMNVREEPPAAADWDETCHRCGSEEIYPVVSRAQAYARALVISMFSGIAVQILAYGARQAGLDIAPRLLNGVFLLMLAAPLLTAVWIGLSPRMTCRNCEATWRGKQPTI